ncbi:MAG TPA: hypothetical protein VI814_05740 [Candidatus Limnocylindria bacterium]
MSDARRVAGIAGVVLAIMMAVAFVLDFVLIATTGGPPQIYPETISVDLVRVRASAIWPLETWLYSLQVIPFTLFILGVRNALRAAGREAAADTTTLAGLLFIAAHTLHNLAILTVVQYIAPVYAPDAPNAAALEAATRALIGLASATFLPGGGVGSALLVISLVAFAMGARGTGVFPAWSTRFAWAGAVLLAVAYLQYVIAPAFFIALFGYLAFIGWVAVLSASFMRSEQRRGVFVPQPA